MSCLFGGGGAVRCTVCLEGGGGEMTMKFNLFRH